MTTRSANPGGWKTHAKRRAAVASRWLHVYLSMVSFAVVLFFAVTGLTLNHPDWFASQQRTSVRHGAMDAKLLAPQPDKLGIVEMLRSREHVHGAVGDVSIDDSQITVSLRAPGYTADTYIDRATGKYDLTEVSSGLVAVMNDLHKGRDSGKAWGWVIDSSAVLLALVSLTGLVLLFFLAKRRTKGIVVALLGGLITLLLYHHFVP